MALLRNEGGSVGTSLAQTIVLRQEQFHVARVGEFLDPLNPAVNSFSEQAQAFFFQLTPARYKKRPCRPLRFTPQWA
jgi:DHA2 family multidrug resistance protein